MSEQFTEAQPKRRMVTALVCGDNAAGLELAALDEAREVFGGDARLELRRDYAVYGNSVANGSTGKWRAAVTVEVIE